VPIWVEVAQVGLQDAGVRPDLRRRSVCHEPLPMSDNSKPNLTRWDSIHNIPNVADRGRAELVPDNSRNNPNVEKDGVGRDSNRNIPNAAWDLADLGSSRNIPNKDDRWDASDIGI